jgi:predicted nuclease of predicted toxin-antitoxin system
MNLLADEGVDRPIVEQLRHEGHAVVYVAEISPSIEDEEVLRQVNDVGAILVTSDKDFGELVFRQRRVHTGVILLRLAGLSATAKADVVVAVLRDHGAELPGGFTVVTSGTVRIRRSV